MLSHVLVLHKMAWWRCTVVVPYALDYDMKKTTKLVKQILDFGKNETSDDFFEVQKHLKKSSERRYTTSFIGNVRKDRPWFRPRQVAFLELPGEIDGPIIYSAKKNELQEEIPDCLPGQIQRCFERIKSFTFLQLTTDSKTGLFLRGDDITSKRLYDFLLLETIPIVITDHIEQKALQPCFVPWEKMLIFINEEEFMLDPVGTIKNAIPPDDVLEEMQKVIRAHKQWFIWEHPDSVEYLLNYVLYESSRRCMARDNAVPLELRQRALKVPETCPYGDLLVPPNLDNVPAKRKNWLKWKPIDRTRWKARFTKFDGPVFPGKNQTRKYVEEVMRNAKKLKKKRTGMQDLTDEKSLENEESLESE
eukprot:Trichotokara_eunicae@DN6265_c0_g1_i1.p1